MDKPNTTPSQSGSHAHIVIVVVALTCGTMLACLSIARYLGYNAGMLDLGNMSQAIWSATQGKPLIVTFPQGQMSRLSLHVELIYFLLAIPYAVWPDPRLLLIVQAVLFTLGALPVYRLTMRSIGSPLAARGLAVIYLFYPTAQTSVLFDFHGDTLAMPLLLFALDAWHARAWRSYTLFLILALACKWYVAIAVAGIGLHILLTHKRSRLLTNPGFLTLMGAIIYGAVAFLIIRPAFATDIHAPTQSAHSYITFYFGQFSTVWQTVGDRLLSTIVVFGPVLLLARSGWSWLLIAFTIATPVLLSSGPGGGYDFRYHHYATVVPFIIMATIDGLHHQSTGTRKYLWRNDLIITVFSVFFFNILLVDTPLNPLFWMNIPAQGLDSSAYGITYRDEMKNQFLAQHVPDNVPLATTITIAPHLANRHVLYLTRYPDDPGAQRLPTILPHVDYVLTDALFDYYVPLGNGSYGGGISYEQEVIALMRQNPNFTLIAEQDGLLLFKRQTPRHTISSWLH